MIEPLPAPQYPNPYYRPNDTAESRLAKTKYLVEASIYEQQALWEEWSIRSTRRLSEFGVNWEQVSPGWLVTVGHIGKQPVCVSLTWNAINGHLVCFFHPTSRFVDHQMIECWLAEHCQCRKCDPDNFGHCIDAIKEPAIPC